MSQERVRALLKDPRVAPMLAAKLRDRRARQRPPEESGLTEPQSRFLSDPAKMKAACCTRRAGKSYALADQLVDWALMHEFAIVPYITLTRENAKNIIWPSIVDVCRKRDVQIELKRNSGDVHFPHNGSKIILRGCSDKNEIEKLRGPKYPGAVVDEAQGFPHYLTQLIDEVLEPATMDYNGQILVTGTPGPLLFGPFYEIVSGAQEGWSVHKWSWADNPHLDTDISRFEWIERLKKRRKWTDETPQFRREYLGEWVRDDSGLVYRFYDHNIIDSFNPDRYPDLRYVLGIDLGWNDPTAFVVMAYSEKLGEAYILESYQEQHLLPTEVAIHVSRLSDRYDFESIVADSGAFGKGYVETMRREHGIPVDGADKAQKMTFINHLNGDLASSKIKIVKQTNLELLAGMAKLQWSRKSLDLGKPQEDRSLPNHLTDAALYGYRACHLNNDAWEKEGPLEGTLEWWRAVEEAEEAAEEERAKKSRDVYDWGLDEPEWEW